MRSAPRSGASLRFAAGVDMKLIGVSVASLQEPQFIPDQRLDRIIAYSDLPMRAKAAKNLSPLQLPQGS